MAAREFQNKVDAYISFQNDIIKKTAAVVFVSELVATRISLSLENLREVRPYWEFLNSSNPLECNWCQ